MVSGEDIRKTDARRRLKRNLRKSIPLYFLIVLPVIWYIIFCYVPMAGISIAFKDYNAYVGIWDSPWCEEPFYWFEVFWNTKGFWDALRNTVIVGSINTVVCFVIPVVLALMFNEMRAVLYKKSLQCVSYMPYFVSTIALVSIFRVMFGMQDGVVNNLIASFGGSRINFIDEPGYFIPIYVGLNIWKGAGWGTIIYTAAMAGIDMQLYEAADIEGAGRFAKIRFITLPSLAPTLIVMMILAVPGFLGGDFETVLLLQTAGNRSVSEILATYIYRFGIGESQQYEMTTAIGLCTSVLNLIVIFGANAIARRFSEYSLF